jgi:ATP-dependent Clp endopeptidase proteolytic subunit ClpP
MKNKIYWASEEATEELEEFDGQQQVIILESPMGAGGQGPSPKDDYIEVSQNRIYYYAEIQRKKILTFNKALRELSVDILHSAAILETPPARIFIHINSQGGELFTGMAAVDSILNCKAPTVSVIDGCAASAATLMSVVADERKINKHAFMLIHQLSSGMWGKYRDIKDEVENLDKLMETIRSIYSKYTKIPKKKLDEILDHDLWLSAEECLKYGLVDEIIGE